MKSLKQCEVESFKLSAKDMNTVKGGATQITVEAQIDICSVGPNGVVSLLYCDRRRKRLGA